MWTAQISEHGIMFNFSTRRFLGGGGHGERGVGGCCFCRLPPILAGSWGQNYFTQLTNSIVQNSKNTNNELPLRHLIKISHWPSVWPCRELW